ncbi:hypothetical protein XBKQ1_2540002 [Xenorhabdus bovienii str. kraussei Quebec]|uniref:Uncharacterized protein n=1 Tax=Xenorhabdus bovienii str. kraussei Quebec TaxID=1398203 RepID=A0A077PKG1_XENBV|nr:hypothetical protein XBKQ1_2540002 [Xenorhabdus bovienii str. kraussei Quebec]
MSFAFLLLIPRFNYLDAETIKSKHMLQIGEKSIGYTKDGQFNLLFSINSLYIRPGEIYFY